MTTRSRTLIQAETCAGDVGGRETSRKAIHAAVSVAAAGVVWQLPVGLTRPLLIVAFLVAVLIDWLRRRSPRVRGVFQRHFGPMLRHREAQRWTGATTLAAGFALAALVAPPFVAAIAILTAGLSDAAAALVGRRFGRHRTVAGKSLEGSVACFVVALGLFWLAPGTTLAAAATLALLLTAIELVPLPVDDNLVLPLAAAILYGSLVTFGL